MAASTSPNTRKTDWSKIGIRAAIGVVIALSLVAAFAVEVPTREVQTVDGGPTRSEPDLPDIALGQTSVYRLELFLLAFYGGLLIVTPAFRGVVGGRLPSEISARGAKFAEEAADSIKETQKLADDLRGELTTAQRSLARARLNIDQLAKATNTTLED